MFLRHAIEGVIDMSVDGFVVRRNSMFFGTGTSSLEELESVRW